jgi:hypothetical protein
MTIGRQNAKAGGLLLWPNGDLLPAMVDDAAHTWDATKDELRTELALGQWHYKWSLRFTPDGNLLVAQ